MAPRPVRLIQSPPPLVPPPKGTPVSLMIRAHKAAVIALTLCAGLAVAGCSTPTRPTGTGDISGQRLAVFASDRGNALGQYDILLWDFDASAFKELPGII